MEVTDAKKIALDYINSLRSYPDDDYPVILTEKIIEHSFGWIFYYNGKKYFDTKDDFYSYIGNVPVLVDRNDGSVIKIWKSGISLSDLIAEYKLSKNYYDAS